MDWPRIEPSSPWQEAGYPPSEPWHCFCMFISYQNAGQYSNMGACPKQNIYFSFYYCPCPLQSIPVLAVMLVEPGGIDSS